ncbi:MAG: hypothetical protein EOP36_03060 [Rubrivivax sp.]|nr:MAG: hypothetical protein EOP36_03060 [Rubrivivax sp.]
MNKATQTFIAVGFLCAATVADSQILNNVALPPMTWTEVATPVTPTCDVLPIASGSFRYGTKGALSELSPGYCDVASVQTISLGYPGLAPVSVYENYCKAPMSQQVGDFMCSMQRDRLQLQKTVKVLTESLTAQAQLIKEQQSALAHLKAELAVLQDKPGGKAD